MLKKLLLLFIFITHLAHAQIRDSVELEAFMDGVVSTLMESKHIVGATLAIVQDGKTLVKKGYGYSDYEKQRPVDPDRTLFRIGSITKLFVWTSIMRLAHDGKLDLNADVNIYLKDFKIPEKYGQPITLTHLLTHTPGFEDPVIGLFAQDSSALHTLGEILKRELPERVRPPFTQASYSNHGTGIAAYIVEQVTGMSFNEYVEKTFLVPLGMEYTTLRQPLPARLQPHMSSGYKYTTRFEEKNFEYVPLYPVGAASASAADMVTWMLAYLQHGTFNEYIMIDSAALALMSSEVKRHHPQVNPMHYGLMDLSYNGVNIIGHGGDTFWFHSLMAMLPDHNIGFFLSFNTDKGGGVYLDAFKSFMDRYFPDQRPLGMPMPVSREWLNKFAGEYRVNRFTYTDITKIGSLFGTVKFEVADSLRLSIATPARTEYYIPIDSSTFRKQFSNEKMAFEFGADGKPLHAYDGFLAIYALDKVEFPYNSSTHIMLLVIVLVVSLGIVVYWPLVKFIRRGYSRSRQSKQPIPISAKAVAWINSFLVLVFVIGLLLSLGNPEEIVFGVPTSLKVLLIIPIILIVTTLTMLFLWVRFVQDHVYRLRSKILYAMLCLINILALWQLNYWNFVGFNY
jgi:CubicO group peptidase (beta-lactamase class C family)